MINLEKLEDLILDENMILIRGTKDGLETAKNKTVEKVINGEISSDYWDKVLEEWKEEGLIE